MAATLRTTGVGCIYSLMLPDWPRHSSWWNLWLREKKRKLFVLCGQSQSPDTSWDAISPPPCRARQAPSRLSTAPRNARCASASTERPTPRVCSHCPFFGVVNVARSMCTVYGPGVQPGPGGTPQPCPAGACWSDQSTGLPLQLHYFVLDQGTCTICGPGV